MSDRRERIVFDASNNSKSVRLKFWAYSEKAKVALFLKTLGVYAQFNGRDYYTDEMSRNQALEIAALANMDHLMTDMVAA